MKLTKKAAALLLAASLAVSVCATPVFADGGTTPATPNTHEEIKKDDTTESSSSQTEVKYKVTEGYTWAIPATIDFGENAGLSKKRTVVADQGKNGNYSAANENNDGKSGNVYVTGCRLKPGTKLTISISSTTTDYEPNDNKGFFVKTTNGTAKAKLYYEIYKEKVVAPAMPTPANKLDKTSQILKLNAGTDADSQDLTFILTTGAEGEIAGDCKGTVVFEAKVDKAT